MSVRLPDRIASLPDVAQLCEALALRDAFGEGAHKRQIVDFRTSDTILNYVNGKEVARYARAGLITPDHVIRTGPWPLIVPAPEAGRLDDFKNAVQRAARTFTDDYSAYFARQKTRAKGAAMRDPLPRVVLVPGVGLMGLGANAKEARIAADVAEAAAEGISGAEAIGKFKSISKRTCLMSNIGRWPSWPAQAPAAGRPGRGNHRERRSHRRGNSESLRRCRRGSGPARHR